MTGDRYAQGGYIAGGVTDVTKAYEWHIEVRQLSHYGDRIVQRTPAVIVAATQDEVTAKVRAAFGATYDHFRKFWSHTWSLREVREVSR